MSSVSATAISIQATTDIQNAKKQCDNAQADSFSALFSMFTTTQSNSSTASSSSSSSSSSSNSASQGNSSISNIFDVFLSENSAASSTDSSSFSSDFTNAFGNDGGPLFDWINKVGSALNLTSDQSAALQKIAVEFKDTTGSASDVQAISAELTTAGIG